MALQGSLKVKVTSSFGTPKKLVVDFSRFDGVEMGKSYAQKKTPPKKNLTAGGPQEDGPLEKGVPILIWRFFGH